MNKKIILYGNYGVGKSCILNRLMTNSYNDYVEPTIGASFTLWKHSLNKSYGIWDTAGQERFSNLLPIYLRDANAIIYCWDSTIEFDTIISEKMYNNAKQYSSNGYFCLVLTKMDKLNDKTSIDTAKQWCITNNIDIYFTSSYTGIGIPELFNNISDIIEQKNINTNENDTNIIKIENIETTNNSKKCKC